MNCENCTITHLGSYGSGRFCSAPCARSFSTKSNRQEINSRVSKTLKGRPSPLRGRIYKLHIHKPRQTPTPQAKQNIARGLKQLGILKLQESAQKWLTGEIPFTLTPCGRNIERLKKMVILLRGNQCETCGWDKIHPVTGRVPVQLHHKDGDHSNNQPSNVQLLCPNCHSLTPNYMALNKGTKAAGKRHGSPARIST